MARLAKELKVVGGDVLNEAGNEGIPIHKAVKVRGRVDVVYVHFRPSSPFLAVVALT